MFDNLFLKHNWKYLGLREYNKKREILNLRIIKQLNSYQIIGQLRAGSLRIDILERVPKNNRFQRFFILLWRPLYYRRFHILLSNEKNQETSYIGWKLDFLSWRHSTMKNLQYHSAFSSSIQECAGVPINEIFCPLKDEL